VKELLRALPILSACSSGGAVNGIAAPPLFFFAEE